MVKGAKICWETLTLEHLRVFSEGDTPKGGVILTLHWKSVINKKILITNEFKRLNSVNKPVLRLQTWYKHLDDSTGSAFSTEFITHFRQFWSKWPIFWKTDLFLKKYEDFAIFAPKFTQSTRRVVCNWSEQNFSEKVNFSIFANFFSFFEKSQKSPICHVTRPPNSKIMWFWTSKMH